MNAYLLEPSGEHLEFHDWLTFHFNFQDLKELELCMFNFADHSENHCSSLMSPTHAECNHGTQTNETMSSLKSHEHAS